MIFIGFGLLLTSFHRFRLSQVINLFWIAALTLQYYFLFFTLWQGSIYSNFPDRININSILLTRAEFAAGAMMIACSAVLGKANQLQFLIIAMVGVGSYTLNEAIIIGKLEVYDIGGSMIIHTFGGCYGLVIALFYRYKENWGNKNLFETHDNLSAATIGTLFLWVFWPSFNSALATSTASQNIAVVNTYFALIGSCLTAYMTSFMRGSRRFKITSALNPSLSGAIIIAASADILYDGWVAYVIGGLVGIISVLLWDYMATVFTYYEYSNMGCIVNLHIVPGILGGLISGIVRAVYINNRGGYQVAATVISIALGSLFGLLVGVLTMNLHEERPTNDYQNDRTAVAVEDTIEGDLVAYAAPIATVVANQYQITYKDDHGNNLMTVPANEPLPMAVDNI